jgi:hypothetical protein
VRWTAEQTRPLPETLLLVCSAKKRTEAAPGVGVGTDMFMIGPLLGSFSTVREDVLGGIADIYQETQKATQRALLKAERSANKYVAELTKAASPKHQASAPESRPTPSEVTGDVVRDRDLIREEK